MVELIKIIRFSMTPEEDLAQLRKEEREFAKEQGETLLPTKFVSYQGKITVSEGVILVNKVNIVSSTSKDLKDDRYSLDNIRYKIADSLKDIWKEEGLQVIGLDKLEEMLKTLRKNEEKYVNIVVTYKLL